MLKSSFLGKVCGKYWGRLGITAVVILCLSFTYGWNKQQAISWGSQCLYQAFDILSEPKIKRWEFNITPENFIRFRKVYISGKQEYYSLSLKRFSDMDYLGNTNKGTLRLKALADDIIVQTYNDPKGNVDSMTTALKIPVKNMSAERLDSLYAALMYLKQQ